VIDRRSTAVAIAAPLVVAIVLSTLPGALTIEAGAQTRARRSAVQAPHKEAPPFGFVLARLRYSGGGDWYSNPSSLPNLLKALQQRTTIPVASVEEKRVAILDEELFTYPFLYMNGHGTVRFSAEEVVRLRDYLMSGGFLFADDNYGMDATFRQEIRKVFPESPLVQVPFDHAIYHSFYDMGSGPPKVHEHDGRPPQGLGIFHDGRLVVYYTYESDVGDGLEDPDVHRDPPEIREAAMRMAINVVMYALTS